MKGYRMEKVGYKAVNGVQEIMSVYYDADEADAQARLASLDCDYVRVFDYQEKVSTIYVNGRII